MFSTRFIAATEEFGTVEKSVPAPLFRKSFYCDKPVSGSVTICGLGFYRIFINGVEITKGLLAPYISNPDDLMYYDSYDLSSYLQTGENVIGIILGNGFLNSLGGHIWDFTLASFRSAPKLALSVSVVESNGDELFFEADETFLTHPSPIIADDERMGEIYDARKEVPDWANIGYAPTDWKPAIAAVTPKGKAISPVASPIVQTGEWGPIAITPSADGYLYDFGVNTSGLCRLKIKGTNGQRIDMYFGEKVVDGVLDQSNLVFQGELELAQHDAYICSGNGYESYLPSFTYHGFRYVYVTGLLPEQATESLLTYCEYHSDLQTVGDFSCSCSIINKLQEITRRSTLSNFHYFPTDCPHREKNGWTGDVYLSAEEIFLNFSGENSLKDWLRNICLSLDSNGAPCAIVPTTGWGYDKGPGWDGVMVELPYLAYRYRGDISLAEESHSALVRYLHYLDKRLASGIAEFGLGDWCCVGCPDEVYLCPLKVSCTLVSMDTFRKLSLLFRALNDNESATLANLAFLRCRKAFREQLIDFSTMTVEGDCQTSQAMAIYYGAFEPSENQKAVNVLVEQIHREDDHMVVGVFGNRVIFHVLSDNGYTDLAYLMMTREDYPSLGNILKRGATSLWEALRPETVEPSSMNHHFWGDISNWFITRIGGIRYNPDAVDITACNLCPNFPSELENAKSFYRSKFGEINISWERKGNEVILVAIVPAEIHGTVFAPAGYRLLNDNCSFRSGVYRFISEK